MEQPNDISPEVEARVAFKCPCGLEFKNADEVEAQNEAMKSHFEVYLKAEIAGEYAAIFSAIGKLN